MELVYYVIRHIATGELMPQMRKNRGYSHWNPNNPIKVLYQALPVPRLIDTRRTAHRCIVQWSLLPNSRNDMDGDLIIRDDGRKLDDLEVVEVTIKD